MTRVVAISCTALFAALPLAAQTPATAPAAPAAPVKGVTVEGITEYTLGNGLKVLLFPDNSKPQTTVNITYLVGSRFEGYGETGMAHLLEHLMFKGSTHHTNVPQELSEHGAQPNGTTWYDRTNYFESFPAKDANLRWALELESDRMVHSFIAKKDLESEMTVVRNEYESGENDPGNILLERIMSTAYLWHNYGKSTIGARSDIEQVPIERLQAFYHRYYEPDNAVLVIAGRFVPATALAMVQQTFGVVPRPRRTGDMRLWSTYTAEPTQDGERSVTLKRVGDVQALGMAWHVPAGSHPDFPAIEVLASVLSSQPTGRLYRSVVTTGKATSINAFAFQLKEPGVLVVQAQVKKTDNLLAARDAVNESVDSMLTTAPVTKEEVERAKAELLSGIALELTSSGDVGLALSEWVAMGDWRFIFVDRDRIKQVTAEDVMRVAHAYLKPDNRTVGLFYPDASPQRADIPAAIGVAAVARAYHGDSALAVGEDFDATPANIDRRTQHGQLGNGLKYALLPKKTRGGAVQLSMQLHFGTEQALMNKGAAPDMAADMLMRGTTLHTRQQIVDTLNLLQAQVAMSGNAEGANVTVTVTRQHLADALRVMAEVLRQPAFDAKEFDLLRQQDLTSLESGRSDPQAQAVLAIQRALSAAPKGHPDYVGTLDESVADYTAAKLDDAKRFYHDFYGASNGDIGIVGDFSADSVRAVLVATLGDWKSPAPYARVKTPTHTVAPLNVSLATPDKANAIFLAGKTLPLNDDSPDYATLMLADYMLGGGFLNSRLATRIRQKDGLSYGVGSQFAPTTLDSASVFEVYAIYAPENRDHVASDFVDEMNRAIKSGFTADEIAKAKEGILGDRQIARSDDRNVAARLSTNLFYGDSFSKSGKIDAALSSVTAAQLQAAVARYLDPASMAVVKAGDFDKKPPTVIKP
ncbi:MAG TPA: pitrilysin family protein [Gemmatimonadales bacterium]|nr:pitrilysin family protein [Gemmatimonadales bacterium]